jgi:cytochrome b subunit of formate dehydrogenase
VRTGRAVTGRVAGVALALALCAPGAGALSAVPAPARALAPGAAGAGPAPAPAPAPAWRESLRVAPADSYRVPVDPRPFGPDETARCLGCHGIPSFWMRDSVTHAARLLTVDPVQHRRSVHGRIACARCHPDVRRFPHGLVGNRPRVGCDADCHASDAAGRPLRHAAEAAEFARDVHARGLAGDADLPDCAYCHGNGDPHAVPPARGALAAETRAGLCARCHEDRERMLRRGVAPAAVASYRASFHGKALQLGSSRAPACDDCHTAHHVLVPGDTASAVNAVHLERTCGKEACHPGASRGFALSGANHLALRLEREPALAALARALAALGTAVVVVLAAGVLLDLLRRLGRRRAAPAPDPAGGGPLVERLTLPQRAQHLALVASFSALALSGLPLRFPDLRPFRALGAALGGLAALHAIHRGAAVVLILTGLAHLAYALVLLVAGRLRRRPAWGMLPSRADLGAGRDLALWHLRLRPAPPAFDRHGLREKIHYFAVLLGVPLMALTGLVLWFPSWSAARLPDGAWAVAYLAHSDEALAAVLVVLIWHVYHVHLVPGAGQRFMTWLDGRVSVGEWRELHGGAPVPRPAPAPERDALARATPWLLLAITLAGLLLRVREAARTPFWFDELFTLWMARHPLAGLLALLPGDVHPPLHPLLVSLWRAIGGEGPFWLKTSSLLPGLAAILVTYAFARALFGRGAGLVAAALLALHPTHVYLSQELRGYPWLCLAVLLAAWAAWRWAESGRIRYAMAWPLAGAFAVWVHYLAAVPLALLALATLPAALRTRRGRVAWLLGHAALLLLCAPLLALLPVQLRLSGHTWRTVPEPGQMLELARRIAFGARYLVPVLGIAMLLPLARRGRRRAAAFAWAVGAGTILLTYAVSLGGPRLFAVRYMYFTLPFWCALLGAGLLAIPWRRAVPVALVAALALEARAAMIHPSLPEAVDLARVARLVGERSRPGDLLFCADTHSLLTLDYHLPAARGRLLTRESVLPFYRGGSVFPPDRIVPTDTLRAAARDGRRWWAVYVPEPGRPGLAAAAALDSAAGGARRAVGMATVWASDPAMLRGGSY